MIFNINRTKAIGKPDNLSYLVVLQPSELWKSKRLNNDGFPKWCSKMHKILQKELGFCGITWSSRKYNNAKKLYVNIKDINNMSLFLLKYK